MKSRRWTTAVNERKLPDAKPASAPEAIG